MALELFQRYRLRRDVDRYPHFLAPAGACGTLVGAGDYVRLRMDEPIPGAEEWDNEIVWMPAEDPEFGDDIEPIGAGQ